VRRATVLLAAAAAVVAFSIATPALACDSEKKAEAAAVVAKADEAKPVTAAAKGGCGHAAAEMAAVDANGKPAVVKAEASGEGKAGCAKAAKGGCGAKKATGATLAKAEEVKPEEAKTK
jgi:hypothetical protein